MLRNWILSHYLQFILWFTLTMDLFFMKSNYSYKWNLNFFGKILLDIKIAMIIKLYVVVNRNPEQDISILVFQSDKNMKIIKSEII